jgi:cytochrome c oxidase subunit 3
MTTTTADNEPGHAAGAGHGEHPEYLQHHFDTVGQQISSSKLGMWVFLGTEVLMFSGLFLAYAIARYLYPDMMLRAHEALNVPLGSLNTVVLITSSLTMALAVRAAQVNNQAALKKHLVLTVLFACAFLVVKYLEYSGKFAHGDLPGKFYKADIWHTWLFEDFGLGSQIYPGGPQIFFGLYFVMTGLHGVHVVVGIGVLLWIYRRAKRREFHSHYYTPVENVGLYWHLVDLVWIFLFPLLYLVK